MTNREKRELDLLEDIHRVCDAVGICQFGQLRLEKELLTALSINPRWGSDIKRKAKLRIELIDNTELTIPGELNEK